MFVPLAHQNRQLLAEGLPLFDAVDLIGKGVHLIFVLFLLVFIMFAVEELQEEGGVGQRFSVGEADLLEVLL